MFPLVPDIKVGANATRLALIDAVIMRGCNRPAVFYCIVVDIALCKCILNTKNLLCFCQHTKIGDSSFSCIIQLVIGIQSGHDCRASAARDSTDLADQRFYLLRGHSTIRCASTAKERPRRGGGQRGQCSTCPSERPQGARHKNVAFFCNFHSMFLFPLDFSL